MASTFMCFQSIEIHETHEFRLQARCSQEQLPCSDIVEVKLIANVLSHLACSLVLFFLPLFLIFEPATFSSEYGI